MQLQNRFVPCFAGALVTALFGVVVATLFIDKGGHFDKVIGFAGTMIGTITGYYFGGKRSDAGETG